MEVNPDTCKIDLNVSGNTYILIWHYSIGIRINTSMCQEVAAWRCAMGQEDGLEVRSVGTDH